MSGKSEFKVPSALSKEKDVHQESSYRDEPGGDVVLGCVVSGQQSCGGEKGGNISNMDQGNYSGLDRMGNFAQTCERNKQLGSASEISNKNSGLAKSLDSDKTDPEQSLQSMIQPECTKEASCAATEARMQQEKLIRQKKRQKIQPTQGRWLTRKLTEKQTTLEELHLTTRWRSKQEVSGMGKVLYNFFHLFFHLLHSLLCTARWPSSSFSVVPAISLGFNFGEIFAYMTVS